MSGDTRSRKKAGGGAAKNSKSNNQAATRQYAAKKQSKERKKMAEKQKQGHSSSCFRSLTFWTLLALIGLSYGTYQTHPEKFKDVFDLLPPQVYVKFHDKNLRFRIFCRLEMIFLVQFFQTS